MNRKYRGDKCASPNRGASRTGICHEQEQEKEQEGSDRVKNNVRKMKCAGIRSEKLKLEHVRDVLERKPVRGRPMGERPFDPVQREAGIYLRNFVDVFRVIEVDEGKFDCLPEHEPNERDQTDANAND